MQTVVTVAVIALAVALAVAVTHLNDGLQRGIIRAGDPFGVLVVGAKGSGQQLVLSTLLLQGTPVGNIDGHIFTDLEADSRDAGRAAGAGRQCGRGALWARISAF